MDSDEKMTRCVHGQWGDCSICEDEYEEQRTLEERLLRLLRRRSNLEELEQDNHSTAQERGQ